MRAFMLLASRSELLERPGLITRFITGALLLSHGTRKDVNASIFFEEGIIITFDGASMRNVRPDEQSLSGILKAGLRRAEDRGKCRVLQGVTARKADLIEVLERQPGKKYFYEGPGKTHGINGDLFVVFLSPGARGEIFQRLRGAGFDPLRIGVREIEADQAVVLVNNLIDRADWKQ